MKKFALDQQKKELQIKSEIENQVIARAKYLE